MTKIRPLPSLALALVLLSAGAALADDDECHGAIGDWQPRDVVIEQIESLGITADRLRIDDGCYEIRGHDSDGNRVELKLDPITLAPVKLEVRFRPGADPSRYLAGARALDLAPAAPPADNPLLTPGTVPQVRED